MTVSVNKKGGERGLMLLTMAAGAVAMLPAATCGADTWDNSSGDAKWSTAANWADDTEPTLADAVTFPTPPPGGIRNIILAPGENVLSLTFNDIYLVESPFQVGSVNLAPGGLITVGAGLDVRVNKLNSNGITKEGGGTLFLTSPTLTGTIAINAGTIEAETLSNIGPETVPITLGGTLLISGSLATTRTITPNGGSIAVSIGNTYTVNGAFGAGSGALTLDYGSIVLNTASTRTGTTDLGQASVRLNSASALGTGTITNNLAFLTLPGITLENNLVLGAIGTISTSGITTCNGTVNVMANAGITLVAGSSSTDVFTIGNAPNDLTGGAVSSTITVNGTGKLLLAQSSDFVGKWVVESGTLEVADDNRLGNAANSITLSGGTFSANGTSSSARPFIPNGGSLGVTAGNNLTLTAALAANNKALIKTDAGQLTLTVNSTRTGKTTIDGGTLRVQSVTAFGTGSLGTIINSGTLEVGGITLDKLITLNNGATLRGTGAAAISNGTATVASGAAITLATVSGGDVFTLGNAANDLVGGGGGSTITLAGPGKVVLAQSSTYTGNWTLSSGTLEIAADNRLGNAFNAVTFAGGSLRSTSSLTTARPLTVTASGGAIDTSTNSLTINGSANTAWGTGTLTVYGGGTASIARTGGAVLVDPGAVLQINAGTTVNIGGSVDALSDGVDHVHVLNNSTTGFNVTADSKKVGNIDGTGNTSVSAGATVILTANHIRQNALTVSGAAVIRANGSDTGTSKLAALTIPAGGNLDLKDNKLIIPAGGSGGVGSWNGSNYDGVSGMIKSGRNGGSWTGSGIVTSMAAAAPTSTLTNLAVVAASDVGKTTFGGQMVSPTDVLVMYTWIGDANLSGKIDADDYFQIDSHANKSADSAKSWFNGDFNYDGQINGDDYFLIDNAFVGQGAPFAGGALPGGVSSVPEPSSIGVLVIAMTPFCRRRRPQCSANGARYRVKTSRSEQPLESCM